MVSIDLSKDFANFYSTPPRLERISSGEQPFESLYHAGNERKFDAAFITCPYATLYSRAPRFLP